MSDERWELLVKAEALEEEAQRTKDFGHPKEWVERLRNRAGYLRAQAEEAPPGDREDALWKLLQHLHESTDDPLDENEPYTDAANRLQRILDGGS